MQILGFRKNCYKQDWRAGISYGLMYYIYSNLIKHCLIPEKVEEVKIGESGVSSKGDLIMIV